MKLAAIPLHIVDRPTEAFRAVVERPKSWLLAAALLIASTLVLLAVAAPYNIALTNQLADEQIARITANMDADQAAQVREQAAQQGGVTMTTYLLSGSLGAILVMGIGWVARGAVAHFSSMAAGGVSTWAPTFAVSVWSMIPFFFRDLLQTVWTLINGQAIAHQGLSFLVAGSDILANSTNMAYLALSKFDLFALWHVVVFGLALAVATRLSRTKGIVLAAVIWVVFTGLSLLPTLLSTALTRGLTG